MALENIRYIYLIVHEQEHYENIEFVERIDFDRKLVANNSRLIFHRL